ncbi:hypothetical protein AKJ09_06658 [Labilithrix luteola]|uniref:Uncharacterized protein n=1 Tax=Labilithrix luteola TaxID=1391654 RepID=A0A0K1Q3N1_9BACT|nr:hypothetical protein AKJ09_06658 [Labilithrix luteola]
MFVCERQLDALDVIRAGLIASRLKHARLKDAHLKHGCSLVCSTLFRSQP